MKTGIELITAERERQITAEGWTPEHDDIHSKGELAAAAACYAYDHAEREKYGGPLTSRQVSPQAWPWGEETWKPADEDPTRKLVKAGALIAAEIDRINRQKQMTPQ